jgi:hypothetical protein
VGQERGVDACFATLRTLSTPSARSSLQQLSSIQLPERYLLGFPHARQPVKNWGVCASYHL